MSTIGVLLESKLAPQVSQIISIDYAIEAVTILKRKQFPVIVASLRLAPGEGHPDTNGLLPDYSEVCCYLIRKLREEDSANKTTPIIVGSVVDPSADGIYPRAESRVLQAGATKYFQLMSVASYDELADSIRTYLQQAMPF